MTTKRLTRDEFRERWEQARLDIEALRQANLENVADVERVIGIMDELYEGTLGEDVPDYRERRRAVAQ